MCWPGPVPALTRRPHSTQLASRRPLSSLESGFCGCRTPGLEWVLRVLPDHPPQGLPATCPHEPFSASWNMPTLLSWPRWTWGPDAGGTRREGVQGPLAPVSQVHLLEPVFPETHHPPASSSGALGAVVALLGTLSVPVVITQAWGGGEIVKATW